MPTLNTGGLGAFEIPTTQLGLITERVQSQSILASLSPEQPTLYGNVQAVRMTQKPRAQIVAEGAQKESSAAGWASVVANPVKFQTTVRMTSEVKWLDEDHRLQIVDQLTAALGDSMSRAVDLIGLHGINPIDGTRATSVTSFLNQTANRVAVADNPDAELTAAVGAVAGDGAYIPTGVGFDPTYAFAVATQTYPSGTLQGQKIQPNMGFGFNATAWNGLQAATSSTVSGRPEATDTGVRAFVGDWTQIAWGFQRQIPVEVIEYGDPDGGGDLKGNNQIAYRAEGVIYVAIFDLEAFAAVGGTAPTA